MYINKNEELLFLERRCPHCGKHTKIEEHTGDTYLRTKTYTGNQRDYFVGSFIHYTCLSCGAEDHDA